jgi:hypothetical protein
LISVISRSSSFFLAFFLFKREILLSMYYISYSGFWRIEASFEPTISASLSILGSFFSTCSTRTLTSFLKWFRDWLWRTLSLSDYKIYSIVRSSSFYPLKPDVYSGNASSWRRLTPYFPELFGVP